MVLATTVLAQDKIGKPFQELWDAIFGIEDDVVDLQNQIDDIESRNYTMRYVIEGTFNITEDGDTVVSSPYGYEEHWKNIDVPQLTFSDMPIVKVYIKPSNNLPSSPHDMWRDAGEGLGDNLSAFAVYDEQGVLICFKRVRADGTENYYMNGDYKIVVIK